MDEADKGSAVDDFVHEKELKFRYAVLQPVNVCHWCQSPVSSSALFCDADCATDWERDHRMRRISYGVR